jgi:hypothetical protein
VDGRRAEQRPGFARLAALQRSGSSRFRAFPDGRTSCVFDRYKIAVEEQTRKALRHVSAFTMSTPKKAKVAPLGSRK